MSFDDSDSDSEIVDYEVEDILGHKKIDSEWKYLIKWKNYPHSENSYEPESNLQGCPQILNNYKKRMGLMETSVKSSKRDKIVKKAKNPNKNKRIKKPEVPKGILSSRNSCDDQIEINDSKQKISANKKWGNKKVVNDPLPIGDTCYLDRDVNYETDHEGVKMFRKLLLNAIGPEIMIYNDVDDASAPKGFIYINQSVETEGVPNYDPNVLVHCLCDSSTGCKKGSCACMDGADIPYDEQGRLIKIQKEAIYECNSRCQCSLDCPLRLVQKGPQQKLCIKRFPGKGWGVVARELIPKGSFLCQYVGEIVTNEEATIRYRMYNDLQRSYLFDIDFFFDRDQMCPFTIDASFFGNISHFINHSCEPNVVTIPVFIENQDQYLHNVGFFASRDIQKGEELCFDYLGLDGQNFDKKHKTHKPDEATPCLCGTKSCRGFIY